jgi:site-specific recombinase
MRKKQSNIGLVCGAVIIFFVTQILVYMIYPKDKYMLDYIDSNDQARAWIKNYNEMMKNYLIGFVLGLVGYIILCFAFLK